MGNRGKRGETGCESIFDALTTLAVKGETMMTMMKAPASHPSNLEVKGSREGAWAKSGGSSFQAQTVQRKKVFDLRSAVS